MRVDIEALSSDNSDRGHTSYSFEELSHMSVKQAPKQRAPFYRPDENEGLPVVEACQGSYYIILYYSVYTLYYIYTIYLSIPFFCYCWK